MYKGNFMFKSNSNQIILCGCGGQHYLVLNEISTYIFNLQVSLQFISQLNNIFHLKDFFLNLASIYIYFVIVSVNGLVRLLIKNYNNLFWSLWYSLLEIIQEIWYLVQSIRNANFILLLVQSIRNLCSSISGLIHHLVSQLNIVKNMIIVIQRYLYFVIRFSKKYLLYLDNGTLCSSKIPRNNSLIFLFRVCNCDM